MILTGDIEPGQRVTEQSVAERLGISRTPVREAFRELVQMGLLISEPYKGVRAADVDLSVVRQIYEMRANLEPFAAELAASRIKDEDIENLKELNARLARPERGVESIAVSNDEFHLAIAQASRNRVLVDTIADLRARTRGFRIAFHYHPLLIEESVREHQAIIEALIQRSPKLARDAMRQHVKIDITSRIV